MPLALVILINLVAVFLFWLGLKGCYISLPVLFRAIKDSVWEVTKGKIEKSDVKTLSTGKFDLEAANIIFSYNVQGENYKSETFMDGNPFYTISNHKKLSKKYLDKYPVGKSVDVYFFAKKPSLSCLEKGNIKANIFALSFSLFLIIIALVFHFATELARL